MSNQLIHQHFHRDCHGFENCLIFPIEKIESPNATDHQLTKLRKEREAHWQITLRTMYPFGLNVRLKGVGDFNPSQAVYQRYEVRKRNNRSHGRRKPKSRRIGRAVSVPFLIRTHDSLRNSPRYNHVVRTFLYSISRIQLHGLSSDMRNYPNMDVALRDIITATSNLRLFNPVKETAKEKRDFRHLHFKDKGIDFINIAGILRSKQVNSNIPVYFQNKEPPIIGYKLNPSIANKFFNYKQSLTPEVISLYESNNFSCNCHISPFKDNNIGHIITGNLDIIENDDLKTLIKKGPKYRLPRRIHWGKNRQLIENFLDDYIKDWIKKENKLVPNGQYDETLLKNWKTQVMLFVDNRISKGKIKFKDSASFDFDSVKGELERLQNLFVITPADKAGNNVIFSCKEYYVKSVKDELSTSNTYQVTRSSQNSINSINTGIIDFSNSFNLNVKDEMIDIPLIYYIPKMHKNPVSKRFIAGSKKCTIKALSKHFSMSLKLIFNHFKRYDKVVFQRTGLKHFWIIENSLDFLENIKELRTDFLESYDFSTLYTNLPHTEIKNSFKKLFNLVFKREGKRFINVNLRKAFFANDALRNYVSFTEDDMNKVLIFILDNIYVKFGNKVFKQKIGIPIGLDSGQDIANLLLYFYEREYVVNLSKTDMITAKKFQHCFRYIDDLFNADFRDFSNHLCRIYPQALTLSKSNSSDTVVDYLDITISSENRILTFSLYDKRDAFSFNVVNFPYLDSCIPRKPALGIYFGQLIRIARICSNFGDFCKRTLSLSRRLQQQGYRHVELVRLTSRFFNNKSDLINKYNQNCLTTFVKRVVYKV